MNLNIVTKRYVSFAMGTIDHSYCSNAKKVILENPRKCETEIYCENYEDNKDE